MSIRRLAIAAATALAAASLIAVPVTASAEITTGNAATECRSAGYETGVKLDTGAPGTYTYDNEDEPWDPDGLALMLTVTITDSHTFEWESNPAIEAVLIKAGQVHVEYPGGTIGGGDLVADHEVKFGISHITFCTGVPNEEPEEMLTVSKTVDTSYVRHHDWSLDKSVDPAEVWLYVPEAEGPHDATVDWTIDVGYEGYTDSEHMVSGTVTVTNPGPIAVGVDELDDVLTIDGMPTDVMLDCGEIDLTDAAFIVLEVGDSFECTYSVPLDGMPTLSNTATATTVKGGEFSDTDDGAWGIPAMEYDATVELTDMGDLPLPAGTDLPKQFSAPTGGQVQYSHTFAWDDYGQEDCGSHTYDNTAMLSASEVGAVGRMSTLVEGALPLTDSASVTVHVQCYVFDGETAWAANAGPGTDRYAKKGNWATYVTYTGGTKVYDVYAGQTHLAGTATIEPVTGGVMVTVELADDWDYADAGANLKIQDYSSKPSGNPAPGQFMYHTACGGDPCMSGVLPYDGAPTYYGIHLDVGHWVPDPAFP